MRNLPRQEGREGILDSGDSQKQGRDIQTGSRCGVPHVGELLTNIYKDLLCAGNDPVPSSLEGRPWLCLLMRTVRRRREGASSLGTQCC